MNLLLWRIRQWGRRLGAAGLSGSALLVLALGLLLTQAWPLQKKILQQQRQLDSLRAAAQTRAAVPAPTTSNPLAALPPDSSTAAALGELEQLARAHGLELMRGQYSIAALNGAAANEAQLARWQLVLPVEADYPALHAFVAAALERLPNLVLDEVKLKRERIEATDLQAELRFSLFVETAP